MTYVNSFPLTIKLGWKSSTLMLLFLAISASVVIQVMCERGNKKEVASMKLRLNFIMK